MNYRLTKIYDKYCCNLETFGYIDKYIMVARLADILILVDVVTGDVMKTGRYIDSWHLLMNTHTKIFLIAVHLDECRHANQTLQVIRSSAKKSEVTIG